MAEKKKPKRERPPEKESILQKLREYDAEAKRRSSQPPRQKSKQRSYDMER